MSNKYLEKIAEMSEENRQVAKTFAAQAAASVPAHIIGGAVGGKLGAKYLEGTASKIQHSVNRSAARLHGIGSVGKSVGKKLRVGKIGGAALGVGLGMAAAGGIADILALKQGLHGKIKEK
jgi:hypothetical protein